MAFSNGRGPFVPQSAAQSLPSRPTGRYDLTHYHIPGSLASLSTNRIKWNEVTCVVARPEVRPFRTCYSRPSFSLLFPVTPLRRLTSCLEVHLCMPPTISLLFHRVASHPWATSALILDLHLALPVAVLLSRPIHFRISSLLSGLRSLCF
ncbi:hypothetical protein K523DRAFT_121776 [Schizophyllum commune Tattone D]|nr:hypothetical protein K523DRAFT_121776 [Schizophyllum commune Tattone D]